MTDLPTFEPTGEFRFPEAGEYYRTGDELHRAWGEHSTARQIYRAVTPQPEPRIIEQHGKRYRFVGHRRPIDGEWFDKQRGGDKLGELVLCGNYIGPWDGGKRDIYEPIEEKPMLKHVIAGQEPEQPKVIKWGLMKYGEGIILTATGADGKYWNVLNIQSDGRLVRCTAVPVSLGLPLDGEDRRIKLAE